MFPWFRGSYVGWGGGGGYMEEKAISLRGRGMAGRGSASGSCTERSELLSMFRSFRRAAFQVDLMKTQATVSDTPKNSTSGSRVLVCPLSL